jgi:hypothetical protein
MASGTGGQFDPNALAERLERSRVRFDEFRGRL